MIPRKNLQLVKDSKSICMCNSQHISDHIIRARKKQFWSMSLQYIYRKT